MQDLPQSPQNIEIVASADNVSVGTVGADAGDKPFVNFTSLCDEVLANDIKPLSKMSSYIVDQPELHTILKEKNILPKVLYFVQNNSSEELGPPLLFLTNFLVEDKNHSKELIEAGFFDTLPKLFQQDLVVVNDVVFLLSNMAGDGIEIELFNYFFDSVTGISDLSIEMKENCSFFLSNICRFGSNLPLDIATQIIFWQITLIKQFPSNQIVSEAVWSFAYLSGFDKYDFLLNDSNLYKQLNVLLNIDENKISVAALRFFGNLTTKTDEVMRVMLDSIPLLDALHQILTTTTSNNIKKEIYWMLSNIYASDDDSIVLKVINQTTFIGLICDTITNDDVDITVKREMGWCICNIGSKENKDIWNLVHTKHPKYIHMFLYILTQFSDKTQLVECAIASISNMINNSGIEPDTYKDYTDPIFEDLLNSIDEEIGDEQIHNKIEQILMLLFDDSEDDDFNSRV
ncbi:Importin alpha-1 subunit [Entamoeba marina]